MLRFLLTPRWVGLLVVVVVLGFTCVKLSEWQFHRYQERKDSNTACSGRTSTADPVPVSTVLSTTVEPDSDLEWRTRDAPPATTTRGTRSPCSTAPATARRASTSSRRSSPTTGTAVLVDRGWISSPANGNLDQVLPAPASGRVTITGWVRADSDGSSSQVTPSQGSVRAISADAIRPTLPYPVYDGFLDLTKETPPSPNAPAKVGGPDLSGGPSFFYGFQWLFFALLFFGFWCYFAWAEYQEKVKGKDTGRGPKPPTEALATRGRRRGRHPDRAPRSQAPSDPSVDRAASRR